MTIKLSTEEKKATIRFLSSENPRIFKLKNKAPYGFGKKKQKKGKEKKK